MSSLRLGMYPSYDSVDSCEKPLAFTKEQPLSFGWRLLHSTLCLLGGIAFFLGSTQYYPSRSHHFRGSILFNMGCVAYFFGDFSEFWMHNNLELSFFLKEGESDLSLDIPNIPLTYLEWFRLHEMALNTLLTAVGSLSYLIGCILFIPELEKETIGDILFIPGSAVIMISESWKIYRSGCTIINENGEYSTDGEFSFSHIWYGDYIGFYEDITILIGATIFLIGSVLFLPVYDQDDYDTDIAAITFVIGSLFFIFSAIFMMIQCFSSTGSSTSTNNYTTTTTTTTNSSNTSYSKLNNNITENILTNSMYKENSPKHSFSIHSPKSPKQSPLWSLKSQV